MKTYRVKDWSARYENNRTRGLKYMEWIPVPNKHDGDGYTLLVDRPNGAELLGAWLAILQVASKCEPRGTLLRDGAAPHDAASISRMTRLSKDSIQKALDVLEFECKWLEINNPAEGCGIPAGGCGKVTTEGKGTEGNGTEGNGIHARFAEIPTLDELKAYAAVQAIPESSVKSFHEHHAGNSLWLNQHGILINWKIKLKSWSEKDRQPKPNHANFRTSAPDRNAGTLNASITPEQLAKLKSKVR